VRRDPKTRRHTRRVWLFGHNLFVRFDVRQRAAALAGAVAI